MKTKISIAILSSFALSCCFASGAQELFNGSMTSWKSVSGGLVRRFVPEPGSYAKGGEIRFELTAGWKDIVKLRPDYPWSGVVVTCTAIDQEGRRLHVMTVNLGWGSSGRDTWCLKGVLPEGSSDLTFEVGAKAAKGKVDFADASITVTPCDPSKRIRSFRFKELNKKPVDLDFVDWYGDPGRKPPALAGGGFAFFRIDEPGMVFDRFPPDEKTLCDVFRLQVTPGEIRDFFFGVYSEKGTRALRAEVGKFETSGVLGFFRRGMPADITLSRVKNWPQCGDMGRRRSYTVMPDPILPWAADGEDVAPGATAQAMMQLRVGEDAEPGVYRGAIAFRSQDGTSRRATVEIEVLPFRLVRPDPGEYELIAHVGQYGEKAEIFEAMAGEFKSRGFESLLIATHYGNGRMKFRIGADDRLEIESFDRLRFAVRAYRSAGMKGTLFVHLSDKLEVAVAKAVGIKLADAHGEQTNMIPEFETPAFKRRVGEALAAIKAECAGIPLAVLAMDEPNTTNRFPRAAYEIARIRENGIPAVIYGNTASYWNVKPDYLICSNTPDDGGFPEVAADIAARPGARLYLYEGSGSYHYAFGSMFVGRFNHGWGDYLAGSRGHTAWNFLAVEPTDFDGVGHFSGWVHLNHFDADMNLRWSLGHEAICEGYLDRCYINTLEARLKAKAGDETAGRIAAEFEALKKSCRERGAYRDPIRCTVTPAPCGKSVFKNSEMDAVRARIAGWIKELM